MAQDFQFHADLFDYRNQVSEILAANGYEWMVDYNSIDLEHEVNGLEIFGIASQATALTISQLLRTALPQFLHHYVYEKDFGRDPGWIVSICKNQKIVRPNEYETEAEPEPDFDAVVETRGYTFAEAIMEFIADVNPQPLLGLLKWHHDNDYVLCISVNTARLRELGAGLNVLAHPLGQQHLDFKPEVFANRPRISTQFIENYKLVFIVHHPQWGQVAAFTIVDTVISGTVEIAFFESVALKHSAEARQLLRSFIDQLEHWILFNLLYQLSQASKCINMGRLGEPFFTEIAEVSLSHIFALYKLACRSQDFKRRLRKLVEEKGY